MSTQTVNAGGISALGLFILIGSGKAQDSSAGQLRPASDTRTSEAPKIDITELSLEQLMSIRITVTSPSKKAENLVEAPAAIFVMTGEDIRRGGFATLPEAFRMVPGLYVAKVNSHWWTISARGFNDYLNNKMLVLVDGRSVYTPRFGGVFWEIQDIPLNDIDRVEVIRGPGGALWGANAVNGVINIITKSSAKTQGLYVKSSAGSNEGYTGDVRYGGRIGKNTTYRIFGRASYWEPGVTPSGDTTFDTWNLSQGGLRVDSRISEKDDLTFESGIHEGRLRADIPFFAAPATPQTLLRSSYVVRGGYVQSKWNHRFSDVSSGSVLGYCDWTDRTDAIDEIRNTCRLEFQNDYQISKRHSLVWGAGLDTSGDVLTENFTVHGTPQEQRTATVSSFGEYRFDLVPDRLRVSAGSKFEHNSYTGFEIQPQIRGVWTVNMSNTIWSAVSRAIRTPPRSYNSQEYKFTSLPGPIPTYLTATGNPALRAETMRAYELGWRFNPSTKFSLDATIYYNHFDGLINLNLVPPLAAAGPPRIHTNPLYAEVALPWQNLGPGQTHGLEVFAKFHPVNRWMLAAGVTELRGNSVNFNDSLNLPLANSTKHQFNLQSRLNLTSRIEFEASLYHYNGIAGYPFAGQTYQDIPTHNRVDVGVSVHTRDDLTLSLWGRDLGAGRHYENHPPLFTTSPSEVPGQVVAFSMVWQRKGEESVDPGARSDSDRNRASGDPSNQRHSSR